MKIFDLLRSGLASFFDCLKRFPLPIFFAAATTAILIFVLHKYSFFSRNIPDMLRRITMIFALGIPLFLCIKMVFERRPNVKPIFKILVYIIGIAILALYYFYLLKDFKMVSITRYISVTIALYLGFVFIPYFYKRDNFEMYIIKLSTRFFITTIFSIVLFLGLSAILFAVDKLLLGTISEELYRDIWFCVVGIFAPCFFLAGVPQFEQQFEKTNYPGLLRVLLLYIVMPLIIAYTTILYIYFVKIIVTHQWPIGLVSNLVLWYSVVSTVVLFFISPLITENKWARLFAFWFPKFILPLLIMMFISIGIRVNAYGVTENRYFVILLGTWVTGTLLYFNLAKARRNIILPASLACIALLSVFGPWSSYSISKFSQSKRLEAILFRNEMLYSGIASKPTREIPEVDQVEISQILSYFDTDHQLSDIKYLPIGFKLDKMETLFGFPYQSESYAENNSFYYNTNNQGKFIDIAGYDYLFNLKFSYSREIQSNNKFNVKFDNQSSELRVLYEGKEIYRKYMSDFGNQLYSKYGINYGEPISTDEMSFTDENTRLKLKYIFSNIYGIRNPANNSIKVNGLDGCLLLKLK